MFSYIMRVNSENMEDMIFLKSIYSYLGGVLDLNVEVVVVVVFAGRDTPGLDMGIWHHRVREGLPL
jgi:hypothetical protein